MVVVWWIVAFLHCDNMDGHLQIEKQRVINVLKEIGCDYI